MWICIKCRTKVGDNLDVCWRCGTSRGGEDDPDFVTADEAGPIADPRGDRRLAIGEVPIHAEIDGPKRTSRGLILLDSALLWSLGGGLAAFTLSAVGSLAFLVSAARTGPNDGAGLGLAFATLSLLVLVATGLGVMAGAIVGVIVGARKHRRND